MAFLAWLPAVTSKAAVFTWDNSAGGNWNVASNWSSGTVPLLPGQAADIPPTLAVAVTLNISPSIDSLRIDNSGTTLGIPGGQSLTVTGGIANNATITVDSDNNPYGYLTFSGSQTLSGTGSVVLGTYGQLNTSNSGMLTQGAGHTISGLGSTRP